MKTLIAIGIAAGAAIIGTDAKDVTPATAISGRVLFVGPLPDAGGTVKYDGEAPESKPLVIEESKSEGCVHSGSVDKTDRSLIISDGGGIANVVVMVDVGDSDVKPPEKSVALDQKSCRFEPHVTVVQAGTTVEFLNSDDISHNVHTYAAKNDGFNKIISAGAKESQKLDKADRIEIKCDIHPWMNSWLIVADTPYFAVTGADGSFTLPKLPAGTHKLEYWHEKLGKNKGEITVGADGSAEAVTLKWGASTKKKRGRR
jgi:plastocyanin